MTESWMTFKLQSNKIKRQLILIKENPKLINRGKSYFNKEIQLIYKLVPTALSKKLGIKAIKFK